MGKEQTYNDWLAEDFMLDELERKPDINERLVAMYEYLKYVGGDYSEEVDDDM